jgi:hypothetical protein
VHLLRQTLGLIAYYNLQAAQLSYDRKGKGKSNREGRGDVSNADTDTDMDTVTAATTLTYRELVPQDWEDLRDVSQAEANPELCFTASSLSLSLSHPQPHSLVEGEFTLNSEAEAEDADKEWNNLEDCLVAETDIEAETETVVNSAVENETMPISR